MSKRPKIYSAHRCWLDEEKGGAGEIGDDVATGVESADSTPQQQGDGQGGIRTLDTLAGIPVFETGGFNRSPTCPNW